MGTTVESLLLAARPLVTRVTEGPGAVDVSIRRAAFDGSEVPGAAGALVEQVRRHAYTVTEDDLDRVRSAGYSDEELFELLVAAAVGAGHARLRAGLRALGES